MDTKSGHLTPATQNEFHGSPESLKIAGNAGAMPQEREEHQRSSALSLPANLLNDLRCERHDQFLLPAANFADQGL